MRFAFLTAVTIAAVLLAPHARAQNTALAEALFREGKQLLDAKDYDAACPKFAESFRLDAATGTLLALAICHEGQGKLASAWAEYADVASRARREQRPDREEVARERVAALEPQLSTLTITLVPEVRSLAGVEVKRAGVPLGEATWGTAIPVDPGEHLIEVTAPGKKPFEQRVVVGATADKKIVLVAPLAEAPARVEPAPAPVVTAPEPAAPEPAAEPATEDRKKDTLRLAGLITGGAGVVALGVGGVLGLQAKSKLDESNDRGCEGNLCRGEGTSLRNDARSAGNLATIFFIAGGVLTAGGVTLFVLGLPSSEEKVATPREVRAQPLVAMDALGLSVSGGF